VNHGTVIGAFACSIRRKHYVGGTAPFASSLADDAPVDLSRRLAAALPWHGAMDVDCMRAADGTLYFLEINPRLSGNAVFGSKLGIDLPARYIDIVEGRAEAPRSYGIPHGRTLCALSDSVIRWVLKDPRRRLLEAVARHLSWRTCTNIFWSDRALVRAHWRQIRSLIRAGG
jgi:pyruvate carboxylase